MARIHDRNTLIFQGIVVFFLLGSVYSASGEESKTTTKLETIAPSEELKEGEGTIRFGDPETFVEEDVTETSTTPAPVPFATPTHVAVVPPPTVPTSEQVRMVLEAIPAGTEFGKEVDLLVNLGGEAVPSLIAAFTDSSLLWERRWAAAMALGKIKGDPARLALESKLKDPLFLVRMASAKALGELGDPKSISVLHETLADPAMFVRASVIDALAAIKQKDSVPALLSELKASRNFYRGQSLWVREHVVDALAAIGDERAVDPLLALLKDEDSELRSHACQALAQLKPDALPSMPPPADENEDCAARWRAWAKNK